MTKYYKTEAEVPKTINQDGMVYKLKDTKDRKTDVIYAWQIQGPASTIVTGGPQVALITGEISKDRVKVTNKQVADTLSVSKIETAPITRPLAGANVASINTDLSTLKNSVQKLIKTSNYKDLGTKYHTPTCKTWTIKFSSTKGKDLSKIDLSNVKVIDKYGNAQDVSVSWHQEVGWADSHSRQDVKLNNTDLVIKAPQGGYKEGESYAVVINEGVNSFKGTTVMSFVTNTSEYDSYTKIKTKYGRHDYGCNTQAEYDAVMKKLEAEVAKIDDIKLNEFYIRYLNGERHTDYAQKSGEYKDLLAVHKLVGYGFTKCSSADIIKLEKGGIIFSDLLEGKADPGDGSPSSAYDVLFRGITDCDASSQVQIAILDILGYNTVILTGGSHAAPAAEIAGKWWDVETEVLKPINIDGYRHMVGATYK